MEKVILITMAVFAILGGALGYSIKDSIPPVIVYRDATSTCEQLPGTGKTTSTTTPSAELKELSISLNKAEAKLKECFNDYANNCYRETGITTEEITKIQEDCIKITTEKNTEMQQLRVDKDGLMKSVKGCRDNESDLANKLKECKDMLPKF